MFQLLGITDSNQFQRNLVGRRPDSVPSFRAARLALSTMDEPRQSRPWHICIWMSSDETIVFLLLQHRLVMEQSFLYCSNTVWWWNSRFLTVPTPSGDGTVVFLLFQHGLVICSGVVIFSSAPLPGTIFGRSECQRVNESMVMDWCSMLKCP